MSWWTNDPVVEDEPKAAAGDWWQSDPVIGEEVSDTIPQVASETSALLPLTPDQLATRRASYIPPYIARNDEPIRPDLSPEWNAMQQSMVDDARVAGLPDTSDARKRLMDSIYRTEQSGFESPHFIGRKGEPTGDRGVTRDIENLVSGLKAREWTTPTGKERDALAAERTYWENEVRQGMSAKEWRDQTGEKEPLYPHEKQPAEFQQFAEQQAIERAPYWPEPTQGAPQTLPDIMSGRYGRDVRIPENIHVPTMAETGAIPAPAIEGLIRYGTPPGWAQMAAEQIAPDDPVTKIGKGLIGGASEQLASFTTPENLAGLAVMPQAKVAQVLLNLGLGAHAVTAVPSQIKAYGETDDPEEKARIAAGIATSIGLPVLGLAAVPRAKAPTPEMRHWPKPDRPIEAEPVRTTQENLAADVPQSTLRVNESGQPTQAASVESQIRPSVQQSVFPQSESTSIPSETARVKIQGEKKPLPEVAEVSGQNALVEQARNLPAEEFAGVRDAHSFNNKFILDGPAGDYEIATFGQRKYHGTPEMAFKAAKQYQKKLQTSAPEVASPIGVEAAEIQRRNAPAETLAQPIPKRPDIPIQSNVGISERSPDIAVPVSKIGQIERTPQPKTTGKPNALQENIEIPLSKPIGPDIQRGPGETVLRDERIQGRTEGEPRPETVQGTPTTARASKIGKSIEAKAVEAKLTEGFAETALYDPISIREQAEMATDLVKSNLEAARSIVRGEAPLPEKLRGTSLITAVEEHLIRKPDAQLAYELANSPLTSATSAAAQEMRLMAERVPDSITATFREIQEARRAGSKQRGEMPEQVIAGIKKEVVRNASKRPTWEAFVREITCP